MTTDVPNARKPLRVWPGAVLVIVQWLAWLALPFVLPEKILVAILVTTLCALGVVLWWLIFSRARWYERVGALILMVLGVIVTKRIVHVSIATGSFGFLMYFMAIPVMSLALVASAVISRRFPVGTRRAVIAGAIVIGCLAFTLIRTGGASGDFNQDLH